MKPKQRQLSWVLQNIQTFRSKVPLGDDVNWSAEFARLDAAHPEQLWKLACDIAVNGIRDPIQIGHDGRIWNGHHRLRVAQLLNLEYVPVEYVMPPGLTVSPLQRLDTETREAFEHWARQLEAAGESE